MSSSIGYYKASDLPMFKRSDFINLFWSPNIINGTTSLATNLSSVGLDIFKNSAASLLLKTSSASGWTAVNSGRILLTNYSINSSFKSNVNLLI